MSTQTYPRPTNLTPTSTNVPDRQSGSRGVVIGVATVGVPVVVFGAGFTLARPAEVTGWLAGHWLWLALGFVAALGLYWAARARHR